ncbi:MULTISPECIES: hypothetical protein [Bacillaceae]|uniref:DUF8042 domain-containing protein n=1 Tax=Evansella alkalicola TaxID=745819 RepID=A0ABS6JVJ6_9BACI|nr:MULTISPECIES: hypothetical protein [Bacillaceae]MBU9722272.1 hypothetical protein [Bacillus alkalicola]
MTKKLTAAKERFLQQYIGLLEEVEPSLTFVIECYEQGDGDIGERLLRKVLEGIAPYDEQNMTMVSIFGQAEADMEVLAAYQNVIYVASNMEEELGDEWSPGAYMRDVFLPTHKKWMKRVEGKLKELE